MKTFAKLLHAERQRLNLSQQEIADSFVDGAGKTLLSVATWRDWEYDRRVPSPLVQHLVLRELGRLKPRKDGSFNARGRPPQD